MIFIVQHPFVIFWALLAIVLLAAVGQGVWRKQQNALVQKMVSERASENICSFRRAFDLHQVDPWLVRATYEEVRAALGSDLEYVSAGVRASDHLVRDLMIDPDDIEDIGLRVAKRAGYDLSDTKGNPLYEKIETVGDLVMFFTYQRSLR